MADGDMLNAKYILLDDDDDDDDDDVLLPENV